MKALAVTIKAPDIVICFDHFFMSVHLLETINFVVVGMCIVIKHTCNAVRKTKESTQ